MKCDYEVVASLLGTTMLKPTLLESRTDLTIKKLTPVMDKVMRLGGSFWIIWKCPHCGDLVTATTANSVHRKGYFHEDCGHLYTGYLFGLKVHLPFNLDPEILTSLKELL